jgi:hypothetical protein
MAPSQSPVDNTVCARARPSQRDRLRRPWNQSGIQAGQLHQRQLHQKRAVGQQFRRLGGKHQQAAAEQQPETGQRDRQRKPGQGSQRQLGGQAPDAQVQQHQAAQQQADAGDVQHLQRRIGDRVRRHPSQACPIAQQRIAHPSAAPFIAAG